jgi:Raf kinase inhibitor-like YbhB/YbcL family protein
MHGRAKLALVTLLAALAGCGGGYGGAPPKAPAGMALTSPDLAGGTFPARLTCGAARPALSWSGAPEDTRELAIVMRDLDAPGGEFRHWSAWRVPGAASGTVPASGLVEGRNSFGNDAYAGPCPPKGDDPHEYVFTIYALSKPLDAEQGASAEDVDKALAAAKPLARGELRAKYGR